MNFDERVLKSLRKLEPKILFTIIIKFSAAVKWLKHWIFPETVE